MPKLINLTLFIFATIVFLLHFSLAEQAVYGDGIYYYAFDHTLIKDHDLNFYNELSHHYSHQSNNAIREMLWPTDQKPNSTGLIGNKYPIGAPLLWLPAYTLLDQTANTIHFFNRNFPNNGYADLYQIGIGIVNLGFLLIGLNFLYLFLSNFFSKRISLLTILLTYFGTNLLYYGSWDVVNSHPSSFMISATFFYMWTKMEDNHKPARWFLLGALAGLMGLIRTQDSIFILLPISDVVIYRHSGLTRISYFFRFWRRLRLPRMTSRNSVDIIKKLLSLTGGFFLLFSLQMLVWQLLYGSAFHSPYISNKEGFSFFSPHLLGVLFNGKTGLLLWTPMYIIGFIGLWLLRKKNKLVAHQAIAFCLIVYYLVASWSGWEQGESFSIRMLISILPLISLGVGEVLSRLQKEKLQTVLGILIILYNLTAISLFTIRVHAPTYDQGKVSKVQTYSKIESWLHRIIP